MLTLSTADALAWLDRWDAQQTGYLPERETRFQVMLEAVARLRPQATHLLDLCSGPGTISRHLLARFPQAQIIALDHDPALLALGRQALGHAEGRLHWTDHDLRRNDLGDHLRRNLRHHSLDAVFSTTALHWLPEDVLARTYRQLAQLLAPGGLLLNGDNIALPATHPSFNRLAGEVTYHERSAAWKAGVEDWDAWWSALADLGGFQPLIEERARRFPDRERLPSPDLEHHRHLLHIAGFREVGVIWQRYDDHVLMAIR